MRQCQNLKFYKRMSIDLKQFIRDVLDFLQPVILFPDIALDSAKGWIESA